MTNVRATQIDLSNFVDIYFDLDGSDSKFYTLSYQGSSDNGITWGIRIKNLSGDTGLVLAYPNKHVIWDASRDYSKQFSSNFRIKITVTGVIPRQRVCPDAGDEGMVSVRGHSYLVKGKEISIVDFCIDKWEYPNTLGAYPMVFVHYQKAEDYCRAAGKRLCSELQWEYACTGGREIGYPYGSDYSKKRCNTEGDTLFPIGTNLACVTLHGAYDLSGNAYEWVAKDKVFDERGSKKSAEEDYTALSSQQIRGGNWYLGEEYAKCSKRGRQNGAYATRHTGFRCCYSF